MPLSNPFSLIRGLTFDKIKTIASPVLENIINTMTPTASFGDAFTKSITENVNNSDNWGAFGTFLGSTAKALFTEPTEQTNAALPPSTGTITKYAPGVIQAEPPVIEIPEKKYRNIARRRAYKVPRRVVKTRKQRPVPIRKKRKTVNEMTAPKKKKKSYAYKINI